MAAHRNGDGYEISSQNYFSELGRYLGEEMEPGSHQAVSQARAKLDWQAFRHLLREANRDHELQGQRFRYRGHVTRAIDGTQLTLPHSEELLEYFDQRSSSAGLGHYPGALLVTAMNVYTGQTKAARVVNHTSSERDQLRSMIELDFSPGDLSLLDRGFGGDQVFLCFEDHGQFYLCRMRASGERCALYVQDFLNSRKKDSVVRQSGIRPESGQAVEIPVRLIRGPKDSEGKRIVLATNLLSEKAYSRRSLLKLYRLRWTVETQYGRVKNLLKLEAFHAKSVNGVMQEVFANLLIMSLTALVAIGAAAELKLDPDLAVPSFKNAQAVVKRHLLEAIEMSAERGLTKRRSRRLAKQLIEEASRVIWKKQPDRSYPRVSRQPIKTWSLAKNKKVEEYKKTRAHKDSSLNAKNPSNRHVP